MDEHFPRSFQPLTKCKVGEKAWPIEIGKPKISFVNMEPRRKAGGIFMVFFGAVQGPLPVGWRIDPHDVEILRESRQDLVTGHPFLTPSVCDQCDQTDFWKVRRA